MLPSRMLRDIFIRYYKPDIQDCNIDIPLILQIITWHEVSSHAQLLGHAGQVSYIQATFLHKFIVVP